MIAVRKNEDGYIWAYVEFFIVNQDGTGNDKGKWCFVKKCWIHEKYRNSNTLKQLIKEEHNKFPSIEKIYYQEDKYEDRWKEHEVGKMYK
jgi:hypothetical protein